MEYLRIRRGEQTVFVYYDPKDTIDKIKDRLVYMQGPKPCPGDIRLIYENQTLEDSKSAMDYWRDEEGVVLYQVQKMENGNWESVKFPMPIPVEYMEA